MIKKIFKREKIGDRHVYGVDDLPFLLRFLAWFLRGYILFVERTTQGLVAGDSAFNRLQIEKKPAIILIWHGRNFQFIPFGRLMARPLYALTSRSRDGAIMAHIIKPFNIKTVKGSGTGQAAKKSTQPSKHGMQAFRQMLRLLQQGQMVLATADVPPGPVYKTGEGMVRLAQRSGAAIVLMGVNYSWQLPVARTWDNSYLPLPFGRRAFVFAAPIYVPADADDAQIEKIQLQIDNALNGAQKLSQNILRQR